MEQRKYYRADKRDFSIGDTIKSAGEFMTKNPAGSSQVEIEFERNRPCTAEPRDSCLYVFEDLNDAKKHWSKMNGGKLYEVIVQPDDVSHRGDMSLVDSAFKSKTTNEVTDCAKRYWAGESGPKPIVEVLVGSAEVTAIISQSEQERIAHLKSWIMVRDVPADCPTEDEPGI